MIMSAHLALILKTFLTCLIFCGKIQAEKPISVPLEVLKSGHIVVSVKVNEKGPYRLIFDTGAPVTIISSKIATEAKVVKPSVGFSLFGAGGQANIQSIEMGNLKTLGNSAIVMDHPTIKIMSKFFGPIDGIIGFSTYSRYRISINYKDSSIAFSPSTYIPQDTIKAMIERLTSNSKERETICPSGVWGFEAGKSSTDLADGLDVISVVPGSAAANAGIKKGQRVLSLNNIWTDSVEDLFYAAKKSKLGEKAKFVILENDKAKTIVVTPASGI